jgi:CelD/BcsL family acetyltransferase involved in cellulose biosynthesis
MPGRDDRSDANTRFGRASRPANEAMKVTVIRPYELGTAEIAAWRAMQQQSSSEFTNAFLSPVFTLAAGRVRPAARVAVLEDGPKIIGFFPFEQGPLRVGRPIAAGVCDCQAVIHTPGAEWNSRELLEGCKLDVWEFDHLIARQAQSTDRNVALRPSPIIDVSGGYEAYLEERLGISKKIFKSTLYKGRKLDREVGATRFEFDSLGAAELSILIQWKSHQYRRTGHRDQFGVEWIQRLVWDLFGTRVDGCAATLSVLYAADRVVAAHLGLRSDHVLSCWFPAYDVRLARYSPGLLLHLKMAEAAAQTGVRYLDLGKGDEEYKQSLRTGDLFVGEGWIDRPSIIASMRRLQRAPGRAAVGFVLSRPRLRRAARRTLRTIGALRSARH